MSNSGLGTRASRFLLPAAFVAALLLPRTTFAGGLLFDVPGQAAGERLGTVAAAGDVNDDGHVDLLVVYQDRDKFIYDPIGPFVELWVALNDGFGNFAVVDQRLANGTIGTSSYVGGHVTSQLALVDWDGDDDLDLVRRTQQGDKRAFDLLVLKYHEH